MRRLRSAVQRGRDHNEAMPWTLLIRLLSGLLFWRLAARRRAGTGGATASGAPRAARTPVAERVRDAREAASLLSRLTIVAGFALATALCLAGGTSSVVLSPRWLGGVLLAAALFFGVLTFREARLARALVNTRRLRRRDRRLRGEL
jgi:hypothetical protein